MMEKILDTLLLGRLTFHELPLRGKVVLSQLPLNLTLVVVCGITALVDPRELVTPGFVVGQVGTLAILAACALVPWERFSFYWAFLVIPVLDFYPIGLLRFSSDDVLSGLGLLSVFPIMWLAGSGYRPKLMLAFGGIATVLMVWVPHFIDGSATPRVLVSEVLVPFMLVAIGAGTSVMTASGMSQQKRVEELLERSEDREKLLNTVLETVDVGVLVLDNTGSNLYMNSKQRQLYVAALPDKGVPTQSESELLIFREGSDEPVPAEERALERVLTGGNVDHEIFRLGRGPDAKTVSVTARGFESAAGEHAGTVLATTDVSDVVAAVQARDRFLAAMSHEFRTPLTNILGFAELLQDDVSLDAPVRSDLKVMTRNARHLSQMVDDILTAALTGEGTASIRLPVDLAEVVREAAASADREAEGRGIRLTVDTVAPLPVLGDRTGLVRILDNLVSNALKYSSEGTRVTLAAARDGDWAVCTIRDQGMGIAPHELDHVFTRFQRSSTAIRSGIPGTGLGLALAKEVAEQHGGRLEAASELGVGSTFVLRIPLRAGA